MKATAGSPMSGSFRHLLGRTEPFLAQAALGASDLFRGVFHSLTGTPDALKEARERQRAAESRLGAYWENASECLYTVEVGEDGRFVYQSLNPAGERLVGLPASAVSGKTPDECLPAAAAATVSRHYRDCVDAGTALRFEQVLDLPAGVRHWHTSLVPIPDSRTGRVASILGICRDVTPAHDALERINRGQRHLRRLLRTSPDYVFVFNLDKRRIEYVSERVNEALGRSPDEMRHFGTDVIQSLVHPDDRAKADDQIRRLRELTDSAVEAGELRVAHATLGYRWFRYRHVVFSRASDGHVSRVMGMALDITDLKQADQALIDSNERLRTILASISDSYFTIDSDFRIVDINPAALEWLNADIREVVGRPCSEMFPEFPLRRGDRALEQEKLVQFEVPSSFRPNRWLEVHAYPSPDGYAVFFRDITEHKLAHEIVEKTKGLLDSSLNALTAHIVVLDEKGTILLGNQSWIDFVERTGLLVADSGLGANYLSLGALAPADQRHARQLRAGLEAVLGAAAPDFGMTYRTRIGAADLHYKVSVARFHMDGWTRILVAHEDVSEFRLAQKRIAEMSERLLHLQEEERRRIATELHDSTGQHLTAIGLNIMGLRRSQELTAETDRILSEVESSLHEVQKEIRVFSYLLHPPHLERDGLRATLSNFIEDFSRRAGLEATTVIAKGVDHLPMVLQRAILRVIQEALANVHRHAAATRVNVDLQRDAEKLSISVVDDGRGLGAAASPRGATAGVGLRSMRARVEQFGGSLRIRSSSKGTRVHAVIPLGQALAQAGLDSTEMRNGMDGEA